MSTALYRRYRPEDFSQVIGQEHVTKPLMTALKNNKTNHAYLFSGPRGCGKTTSARILARCLNCAEGPTDIPCGKCESCVELSREGSGSLDVIEIDAASHGGVDDARDLRERATFAPARDHYKIFIIDEAHMVTSAGFNALLKIVEEPPEHVKFIFATTEPDKVIETIRSRTHHYPFRLVPPATLQKYLEEICTDEGLTVDPGVLALVVRAGGGSVRDSLSILDQLMNGSENQTITYDTAVDLLGFTHASLLNQVIEGVASQNSEETFKAVDQIIQTGHDPRRFVEDLLERLRDLMVVKAAPESIASLLPAVPQDQQQALKNQAGQFGMAQLAYNAEQASNALNEMTGATSPRLHLELLCAKLLLPGTSAGDLAYETRLERVEERVIGQAQVTPPRPIVSLETAVTTEQKPVVEEAHTPAVDTEPEQVEPSAEESLAETETKKASDAHTPDTEDSPSFPEDVAEPNEAAAPPEPTKTETIEPPKPIETAERQDPTPGMPTALQAQSTSDTATLDELRRRWPDITDELKNIKRTSWALLNNNTQVEDVQGSNIKISFHTEGLANTFNTHASHGPNLLEAIRKVLGADYQVQAVPRQATGVVPTFPVTPAPQASTGPEAPPVTQIASETQQSTPAKTMPTEPSAASTKTSAPEPVSDSELTPSQEPAPPVKPKRKVQATTQHQETPTVGWNVSETPAVAETSETSAENQVSQVTTSPSTYRPDPLKKPWAPADEDPRYTDNEESAKKPSPIKRIPTPTQTSGEDEKIANSTNTSAGLLETEEEEIDLASSLKSGAQLLEEMTGAKLIEEIPKEN